MPKASLRDKLLILNLIKKIFLISFCVISIPYLNAQVTQQWISRYNGSGNSFDFANAITVDVSGNIVVTGQSRNADTAGSEDYVTIKYNSSGVQQWLARYNGAGNGIDNPTAIITDRVGNIYVTGWSTGSSGKYDYVTIKYNPAGVSQWTAIYNGTANLDDGANSIAIDTSGNIYVTGFSYGTGTNYDYVTIKYNNNGVQQWLARYNGPANIDDFAVSVAVDLTGNVFVTGYSQGGATGYDYATVKYNSSGVQQWATRYNGPVNGDDYAVILKLDFNGNIYVAGYSPGSGSGNDYLLVKYNSAGVPQWSARYNGTANGNDIPVALTIDPSGNPVVTGYSQGSGSGMDFATVKYNSSGNQIWVQRYNGPANSDDFGTDIISDRNNNYYVTGYSTGNGSNFDYAALKYDSAGVMQWTIRYNGPANNNDYASAIAIDSSLNIYVTGGSDGIGTGQDYATIKYSQVTGIKSDNNNIPKNFSLSQNYPNPFNPSAKIKINIPLLRGVSEGRGVFVKLIIYDIQGKEVSTLLNEQLKPGTYEVTWGASNYPSGVYFYRIEAGSFIDSKKMVLVK